MRVPQMTTPYPLESSVCYVYNVQFCNHIGHGRGVCAISELLCEIWVATYTYSSWWCPCCQGLPWAMALKEEGSVLISGSSCQYSFFNCWGEKKHGLFFKSWPWLFSFLFGHESLVVPIPQCHKRACLPRKRSHHSLQNSQWWCDGTFPTIVIITTTTGGQLN